MTGNKRKSKRVASIGGLCLTLRLGHGFIVKENDSSGAELIEVQILSLGDRKAVVQIKADPARFDLKRRGTSEKKGEASAEAPTDR